MLLLILGVAAGGFLYLRGNSTEVAGIGFPYALLDLQPTAEHESQEATRTRIFEATRELEGVTVRAPKHFVQFRAVGEEQELMLLLKRKGEKQVDIAGSFDPATFNRVILRFLAFSNEAVRVVFLRDGKEFLKTGAQIVSGSKEPSRLVFDLPHARNAKKPFDTLRVIVEGRSKPTALFTVDLVNRPLDSWLPKPGAPLPVEIGLESRIAVGLSSQHPLEAETILPPNAKLAFGFGQPRNLSLRGQGRPKVRVTVTQGELVKTDEFTLEDGTRDAPNWHSGSITLSGFADRRAQIRFELLVGGQSEGLCAIASPVIFSPGQTPPTVLLITSDTHRADHLGSANSEFSLDTPALDALAARGVLFEHAYSSTNVTNPSHISLMTATHPRDTEIVNNHVQLSQAAQTIAECYREAGYLTYASLCAKHLGHTTSGLGQGFDRMLRPKLAFTDAEEAIDALEDWIDDAEGRPLFVWLHVFDAHHPYGPPSNYDELYWDKETDPFDESLPKIELPNGVAPETIFPPDLHQLRDLDFPRAQYKAEITYLDNELARVFAWPRFGTEALIAMTADHGESFGEHGVYYDHAGAYPQNVHVPLILAGPSIPLNQRSDYPVEQIDIGRTLLNLSGLQDAEFPGQDLLSFVEDPSQPKQPQYTISAHGFDASATFGRLHLVLQLRDGQSTELRKYKQCVTELYDLDQDSACTVDLWDVAEYKERGTKLRTRLIEWLAQARPTGWAIEGTLTAETQAELENLGYAGGGEKRESKVWFEDCED